MQTNMSVSAAQIRAIRPGTSKGFLCATNEAVKCAQSVVGYCNKIKKPVDVERYISRANWQDKVITVTAVRKEAVV